MYVIELHNSGGVIDSAVAHTDEDCAREAIGLIRKAGYLNDGDKIVVREKE